VSFEQALRTTDSLDRQSWPAVRTAGITGLGRALPERTVTSAEVAARTGVSSEWIERRTGIRERRYAAPGQRVSDLATSAGRMALADAGLDAAELDMVLVATVAADEITPGTAPIVAHELGATRAAAIDVGAACTGSIAALAHATSAIEAGRARHVLVIGAEILSRLIDFDDRRTCRAVRRRRGRDGHLARRGRADRAIRLRQRRRQGAHDPRDAVPRPLGNGGS
jgi:3-oxoacyl-(acyl-carrier-protein) synthase III